MKPLSGKTLLAAAIILASALSARASGADRFPITIDGYFLPQDPAAVYAAGLQSHVPLLIGWNSEEMTWRFRLRGMEPTRENYEKVVRELFEVHADEALKLYPAGTREEIITSATDLAGDRFIGYSTWKWADLHSKTGGNHVYRYFYARPRPLMRSELDNATPGLAGWCGA